MAHIRVAKKYELKYWNAHKKERYDRAEKMLELFNFPENVNTSADIGSGPRGGIFHSYKTPVMYAVDPLWEDYKESGLDQIPSGVKIISSEAQNFTLPVLCDLIVSVNALDHSGSLEPSIQNIMSNLKKGGTFLMHIHMRTKDQLNKGHRMLITEKEIDDMLAPYSFIAKKIYDRCPIEFKPYRSYVAEISK